MPLIRRDSTQPPRPAPDGLPGSAGSRSVLRTGSAEQRWAAARTLGGTTTSEGTQALGAALTSETDLRVREAIFTSLVRISGGESVDMVLPCLRSNDPQLRTGAMDALRAMIADVHPVLPALLIDPDPDIRILTCDLVRELPSVDATRLLCELLSRETEANVCAAAVDVLAEIGEADALPTLQACAVRFDDVTFLSFAIRLAMERITAERPVRNE